ncbi:hypothetical protein RPC_4347 [Rhodopseudomonas palustris BisB18]|uniref:Uncharacterized protein n=1 Tax=Rhodopseudomonas palustris (strain BisB18) TaxID=316056 RepID=Q20YB6_RHOPB
MTTPCPRRSPKRFHSAVQRAKRHPEEPGAARRAKPGVSKDAPRGRRPTGPHQPARRPMAPLTPRPHPSRRADESLRRGASLCSGAHLRMTTPC